MYLQAISVCINFSHYLKLVAADNRPQLDRWIVITSPDDAETISVCNKHNIEMNLTCVEFCPGKLFPKGAMINDAFRYLTPGDTWVLLLDADMRLPHNARELIESACKDTTLYYTVANRLAKTELTPNVCEVEGFFQLFHHSKIRPYPVESRDTAGDDDRFVQNWHYTNRRKIPSLVPEHVGCEETGFNRLGVVP